MNRTESTEIRPTRLARLFPWTRLFHGPSIALDTRKLLLAAFALILSWAGMAGLDRLFLPERSADTIDLKPMLSPFPPAGSFWVNLSGIVAEPFALTTGPFMRVFRTEQAGFAFVHAIISAIWLVIVWGTIGGAIARIAAVQHATGRRIGLVPALRFAKARFVPLVGAPLSPMIGIGFFAALCLPIGLLYRIPGNFGTTLAGLLGFLPLLAGLLMALLLAGLAVGWPLMTATVAVEAEDAFDALSRSYSYVTQRPGRYGAYALISWTVGAIGFLVVTVLATLVVHMAVWALSLGGPPARIAGLFDGDPRPSGTPAAIHFFWVAAVRLLAHAWLYSYFFTAATLIYVLLRKDVDGAPYHDLGGYDSDAQPFAGPAPTTPSSAIVTPKSTDDEVG